MLCRFQRGLKRKHLTLIKKLRKSKKEAQGGEKPDPVRTHVRNMIVVPEMIGSIIGIYNGKSFNQVHTAHPYVCVGNGGVTVPSCYRLYNLCGGISGSECGRILA
jgi:ribosomal protein uS19